MGEFQLGRGSQAHLRGVHEQLVAVVQLAIELTAQDFSVTDGLRTVEEQRENVAKGVSMTMESRHLTGHAIDLVPYIDGRVRWDWEPIHVVAEAVRAAGQQLGVPIRWGGAWDVLLSDTDEPPAELVAGYRARREAAGKSVFLDGPHYELPRDQYP